MLTTSIKNLSLFKIYDEINQSTYYGGDQEWYTKKWRRLAGCGPTAVSNILYYLSRTQLDSGSNESPITKSGFISLMEEVWKYVTPKLGGISSTKMLCDGILGYAKSKARTVKIDFIDVPKKKLTRPEFRQLLTFLNEALRNDLPVAFLNLNQGTEKVLYSWHWVTITSLEYEDDGSVAFANILDEGVVKKVDLAQWFLSTSLGGGFVSFNWA